MSGLNLLPSMYQSNYEVAELTWENGQLAIHGLSGLSHAHPTTKRTWVRSSDTLESIVHQGTCNNQAFNLLHHDRTLANTSSTDVSSLWANLGENPGQLPVAAPAALLKKRGRPDSDRCEKNLTDGGAREDRPDGSAYSSASAAICRDNDATMVTWASSHESPRSSKTKATDEDSAHDGSNLQESRHEDRKIRAERCRSKSTRRSRPAAVRNLSERRRRDRINQKMKILQKLVPNAVKTDRASMLDEVIEYLKQLQAQVQMMSMRRSNIMPHLIVPLGLQHQNQQHLQMSSLSARMGIGVGLGMGVGMLDVNAAVARDASQSLLHHPSHYAVTATPTPSFLPPPPPFVAAQPVIPPCAVAAQAITSNATSNDSVPLPDPYCAFLAQHSLDMDLYSKMAALCRPQMSQTAQPASSNPSPSSHENQGAKKGVY